LIRYLIDTFNMSKKYTVKDLVYGDVFRTKSGDQFLMLSNIANDKGRRVCAPERYGKFGGGRSEIPESWPVILISRCYFTQNKCAKCGNKFEELQKEYQVCRECLLKHPLTPEECYRKEDSDSYSKRELEDFGENPARQGDSFM